jgi:hypothetical protein
MRRVTPSVRGACSKTWRRQLEHHHPGAAASLREGLEETLTVMRGELPENLDRILSSTNLIENLFKPGARNRPPGQTLAERHYGAALDRRRSDRSRAQFPQARRLSRCRPWSPRCAFTMPNSTARKETLTPHRTPIN